MPRSRVTRRPGTLRRYVPFFYGRWDAAARAHAEVEFERRAPDAEAGYYADGAFEPAATGAELRSLRAPVLIYAGELDLVPAPRGRGPGVGLFPHAELAVQPGAGHFPWVDDPARFAARDGVLPGLTRCQTANTIRRQQADPAGSVT